MSGHEFDLIVELSKLLDDGYAPDEVCDVLVLLAEERERDNTLPLPVIYDEDDTQEFEVLS